MDIIATIPLHKLDISRQEDEAVRNLSDEECNWYWLLKPKPKNLHVGERVYFVENGLITAWCPIMELGYFDFVCEVSGNKWTGYQARLGQNRVFKNPILHPGFQGWHYVSPKLHAHLDALSTESLSNSQLTIERQLQRNISRVAKLKIVRRPSTGQVSYIQELLTNKGFGKHVIICSPGKRDSENLCEYLNELGFKTRYFHSDIAPRYRQEIVKECNDGADAIVIVDILDGLSRPSDIIILDADGDCSTRNAVSLARLAAFARKNVVVCADKLTPTVQTVFRAVR